MIVTKNKIIFYGATEVEDILTIPIITFLPNLLYCIPSCTIAILIFTRSWFHPKFHEDKDIKVKRKFHNYFYNSCVILIYKVCVEISVIMMQLLILDCFRLTKNGSSLQIIRTAERAAQQLSFSKKREALNFAENRNI